MKILLLVVAVALSGCVSTSHVERDTAFNKASTFCEKPSNISYFYFKKSVSAYKVMCLDGRGREL